MTNTFFVNSSAPGQGGKGRCLFGHSSHKNRFSRAAAWRACDSAVPPPFLFFVCRSNRTAKGRFWVPCGTGCSYRRLRLFLGRGCLESVECCVSVRSTKKGDTSTRSIVRCGDNQGCGCLLAEIDPGSVRPPRVFCFVARVCMFVGYSSIYANAL